VGQRDGEDADALDKRRWRKHPSLATRKKAGIGVRDDPLEEIEIRGYHLLGARAGLAGHPVRGHRHPVPLIGILRDVLQNPNQANDTERITLTN
jgi:hypothetical protein